MQMTHFWSVRLCSESTNCVVESSVSMTIEWRYRAYINRGCQRTSRPAGRSGRHRQVARIQCALTDGYRAPPYSGLTLASAASRIGGHQPLPGSAECPLRVLLARRIVSTERPSV
jgi:hypothetical protein